MNVDVSSSHRVAVQPETDSETQLVNHLFDAFNSEQETPEDMAPFVRTLSDAGFDIQAWITLDTLEYPALALGYDAKEFALIIDAREPDDEC